MGDPEKVKNASKFAKKILTMLNDFYLGNSPFICGDHATLADISAYEELNQCLPKYCDLLDFNPYPNIVKWMEKMSTLPEHDKAHRVLPRIGAMVKKLRKKSKL